jgi:Uncharacterised protein family (UPF0158)
MEDKPKRKLTVDFGDIEIAMEAPQDLSASYLDLETGSVVYIPEEFHSMYEDASQEFANLDTGEIDWEVVLANNPEWKNDIEILQEIDLVEKFGSKRYEEIPPEDSHPGFEDMAAFTETVQDPRLRSHLETALAGRGAFRRFKDVLHSFKSEWERWFIFKDARVHQRILDWLDSIGVEPVNPEIDKTF